MKISNTNNATMNNEVLAQTIMNNTTEIEGMRLASIPVSLLRICPEYQRPTDAKHVTEIANPFNRMYANCLTVSYRDGYFWVIDGQHRLKAAVMSGVRNMACIVLTGMTIKDEAKAFKDLNIKQRKPDPYKIFKANICNGDASDPEVAIDLEIKRVCDKYHIEVRKASRNTTNKTLRCLSEARHIIGAKNYNGKECFEWILDILNQTDWADISKTYSFDIIYPLKAIWVDNHGYKSMGNIEKRLIKAINATTPDLFLARARHDYEKHGIHTAVVLCMRDMILETQITEKTENVRSIADKIA